MAQDISPVHSVPSPSAVYLNEIGILGVVSSPGVGAFGMGRAQLEVGGDTAAGRASPEQEP